MRERSEYQSKVTADTGLTRGRIPCPLLNALGARPGDHLVFRLTDSGEVVMSLLRRAKRKSGTGSRQKSVSGKRR
ncbi:MAG TPA: hypothetical protein VJT09_14930 [Pyrinomonadaceae bacterium]|nr:hypothetical protein [Pyrinomonadaceae bacterium]